MIGLIPSATNQSGDAYDLVGVYGDGRGATSAAAVGVRGLSDAGQGVYGTSTNSQGGQGESTAATRVHGSSTNGLGGQFQGGLAPMQLDPSSTAGHPASGYRQRGTLYVDVDGTLWYCIADGYPGT